MPRRHLRSQNKPEAVINAIFEDSLPESVKLLPRDLARGKGKAPAIVVPTKPLGALTQDFMREHRNVFDGDAFDVFADGPIDTSRIHRGKRCVVVRGAGLRGFWWQGDRERCLLLPALSSDRGLSSYGAWRTGGARVAGKWMRHRF